ncbi:MAG: rhodanese-like domain-containing protein [Armatimonadota bacterium]
MRRMMVGQVIALVLAAGLVAGCGGSDDESPAIVFDVTANQLEAMLSDGQPLVVLDVRTSEEYSATDIPGSVNIPLSELEDRLGELSRAVRTVCVCASGVRSAQAAQLLAANRFVRLYNLAGGLATWGGPWESSS